MSGEHTPGPWAVSKQKARRVTASGIVICNAVLRNRGGPKHKAQMKDEHEAEANACLIAAAPELLEVLLTKRDYVADAASGALTYAGSGDGFIAMATEDLARIDAAIAKARGEV